MPGVGASCRFLFSPSPPACCRPYLMDLESTHGTFLNGERVAAARYIELRPKDNIKFGASSREYVLMRDDMA